MLDAWYFYVQVQVLLANHTNHRAHCHTSDVAAQASAYVERCWELLCAFRLIKLSGFTVFLVVVPEKEL